MSTIYDDYSHCSYGVLLQLSVPSEGDIEQDAEGSMTITTAMGMTQCRSHLMKLEHTVLDTDTGWLRRPPNVSTVAADMAISLALFYSGTSLPYSRR